MTGRRRSPIQRLARYGIAATRAYAIIAAGVVAIIIAGAAVRGLILAITPDDIARDTHGDRDQ